METPLFNLQQFPLVYEPSEDTFLLIDALESDIDFIKSLKPGIIAEIGCGSGVNITSIKMSLKSSIFCLCSDINNQACIASLKTSEYNKQTIEIFNMSFLDFFRNNIFDVLLFNPPYVLTESEEISGYGIERSWAGGVNGREIIDQVLQKIPKLLSKNGVFYLVVIKENNPREILDLMEKMGFITKIVKERKVRGEHLYILRFQKI